MANFVRDNPVLLSGTMISSGDEQIVVGDDRGNSLTFRWNGSGEVREHGSPSAALVDLPADARERRAARFALHAEGKYVQIRYAVEPIGERMRIVTYTMIEDIGAMLDEAETGMVNHAPGDGSRLSVGPD
jgi:hypothetical protein